MATTADFKNGLVLEYNNDLYKITDFQHVKPGKGPAFVRTKLKSMTNGKVLDNTFTAGVTVQTARVETREYQYLYEEEDGYIFMNNESFEQVSIAQDLIENWDLLKEGQQVFVMWYAEKDEPLSVELPPFVELLITYSEPGVAGNTATNASKNATVETGAIIQVPLFIEQGELIKVDTRTRAYGERVKTK